ncbi:MAG TPA: hypothetical protein VK013_08570 [Myxococcaceae bacterium]|nr:hypothetical protein [Myxococcaceae bacterium]
MTRRIMFAACAMAAVAFTGCQDQRRNAADQQQADQYSQVQDGYTGQDTQPTQDLDRNTQDPMSGEATGGAATTEDPAYAGNQPQTGTDGAAMGGSGAATSLTGDVKEASEDKLTVAEQGGQEVEIQLDDQTRFHSADGQSLAATDISEGDQVRASFENRDGERVATDVTVTQSKEGATGGSGLMHDTREGMDDARRGAEKAWDDTKETTKDAAQDVRERF